MNTADETKLCRAFCLTFEALVVYRAVGHCRGKESGPFFGPMPAAATAVFGASRGFAEHSSQMQWFHQDSASCSGSDAQQTAKQWLWHFWGAGLVLGSVWSFFSVQPPSWSLPVV